MAYLKLATEAIVALKDPTGSTVKSISKFIEATTSKPCKLAVLKKALDKGVGDGTLKQKKASFFIVIPGEPTKLPYLVEKQDKAAAKKLGAEWFRVMSYDAWSNGTNPYDGYWGVPAGVPLEPFSQWITQPATASGGTASGAAAQADVLLNVPFSEKNVAKKLGAKWNGERKKWYVPAGLDTTAFEQWVPSADAMAKAAAKEQSEMAALAAKCADNQHLVDILAELSWFEMGGGNRIHQAKSTKLANAHINLAKEVAKLLVPLTLAAWAPFAASVKPSQAEDLIDLLSTTSTGLPPLLKAENLQVDEMFTDTCNADWDEHWAGYECPAGQCWRVWLYRMDHPNNRNVHKMHHCHGGYECTGFNTQRMLKVSDTTVGYRETQTNDA